MKKALKKLNIKFWSREADKKILKTSQGFVIALVVIMVLLASTVTILDNIVYYFGEGAYYEDDYYYDDYDDYGYEEDYPESFSEMDCNVAGIEAQGYLVTYISNESYDEEGYPLVDEAASEYIAGSIRDAENSDNIKAIIFQMDSYGGYPVAAEEIANALKKATKPTVVFIRQGGVSAAYWAATGADTIFASRNSDVGGIGVTMSYLDYSTQNAREGIKYISLSSGKYKDYGDPDKLLTAEERQLLMRDVEIIHENFVKVVADYRNLDIEKVREIADGSTVLGQTALELGLIDKIGGYYDARDYIEEMLGEEVEVCW